MSSRWTGAATSLWTLLFVKHAEAQTVTSVPSQKHVFVSGELAAGGILRSQVALGYGEAHRSWLGVEAWALSFTSFGSLGSSVRAKLPFLDATAGVRQTWAYTFARMPVASSHEGLKEDGPNNRYTAFDGSLTLYCPAPHGYAFVWTDLTVANIPEDVHIFEEHLRAVVGSGISVAVRPSYMFALKPNGASFGPLLEYIHLASRDQALWRLGGGLFYEFSPQWDFGLILTTPVAGPDALSLWDGLWGTGRFRYRWSRNLN